MKRILLALLVTIVALGLFAAVGFSGYRLGYAQGVRVAANPDEVRPRIGPFGEFDRDRMPMREFGFDREFHRGFGMRGGPGTGFGFFSLFRFLAQLALLGLIVWFAYWLFTRNGYRLTRTVETTAPPPPPAPPVETESKE